VTTGLHRLLLKFVKQIPKSSALPTLANELLFRLSSTESRSRR
jgi:hypothetical protein